MSAPRLRNVLWFLLAALALVAATAWFLHTYVRVAREVDLPRAGEARTNPLYALKVALQKDDVRVNARRRLQMFPGGRSEPAIKLAPRDTVVIYNDPRTLSEREVDGLLDWVLAGGHLIVRTPPTGEIDPDAPLSLMEELELVTMDEDDADCIPYRPGREDDIEDDAVAGAADTPARADKSDDANHADWAPPMFCGSRRFNLDGANPVHSWGDLKDGYVFARVEYGDGSVDVLADLRFLDTDSLSEKSHLRMARQLLEPNHRKGTVHLVYAAQMPSLWITLFEKSWMAWAPLVLALAFWLWRRTQRFGPSLPSPSPERRSLLEHIVASGAHAYRYGYGHLLYQAARNAFLARLRRRDPQAAALVGDPQLALLQTRFPDVPVAEIRDALVPPFATDHAGFRSRIATLIRLRNRL